MIKRLPDNTKHHWQYPVISILRCSFGKGWKNVLCCQERITTHMQTSIITHCPSRFIFIVLGMGKHSLFPRPYHLVLEARSKTDCTLLTANQKQHVTGQK